YPGRTPQEISAAHAAATVQPPSAFVEGVPDRLDDAILQALRRDSTQRFHTADAMARALEAAEFVARDADETRVISTPKPPADPRPVNRGYVPPPAPARPPPPAALAPSPAPSRAPDRRPEPRRSSKRRGLLGGLGTLLILGAVAVVVALVIFPLLNIDIGGGSGEGGEGTPAVSPSAATQPSAEPGTVSIPQTVGLATADAIEAASEANLNWRVECAENRDQPEGIIGQEPPAGTSVAPGSRFTMFSARISDCT
ncbi:MAG: PASTA domain-containing protein, partial [Candidatus Limnocylindria bacterium]